MFLRLVVVLGFLCAARSASRSTGSAAEAARIRSVEASPLMPSPFSREADSGKGTVSTGSVRRFFGCVQQPPYEQFP